MAKMILCLTARDVNTQKLGSHIFLKTLGGTEVNLDNEAANKLYQDLGKLLFTEEGLPINFKNPSTPDTNKIDSVYHQTFRPDSFASIVDRKSSVVGCLSFNNHLLQVGDMVSKTYPTAHYYNVTAIDEKTGLVTCQKGDYVFTLPASKLMFVGYQ